MPLPKKLGDLLLRHVDLGSVCGRGHYILHVGYAYELLLSSGVGDYHHVILIAAEGILSFGRQDAYYPERELIDSDDLTHRVLSCEELVNYGAAQDADLSCPADVLVGKKRS